MIILKTLAWNEQHKTSSFLLSYKIISLILITGINFWQIDLINLINYGSKFKFTITKACKLTGKKGKLTLEIVNLTFKKVKFKY